MSNFEKEKVFCDEVFFAKTNKNRIYQWKRKNWVKKNIYIKKYKKRSVNSRLRGEIHLEACILLDFHEFFFKWMIQFIFLKTGIWFIHILKQCKIFFFNFNYSKRLIYTTFFWEGRSETSRFYWSENKNQNSV